MHVCCSIHGWEKNWCWRAAELTNHMKNWLMCKQLHMAVELSRQGNPTGRGGRPERGKTTWGEKQTRCYWALKTNDVNSFSAWGSGTAQRRSKKINLFHGEKIINVSAVVFLLKWRCLRSFSLKWKGKTFPSHRPAAETCLGKGKFIFEPLLWPFSIPSIREKSSRQCKNYLERLIE